MKDVRIHTLLNHPCQEPKAVIIPFAVDEGVTRNGGRAGASEAPAMILDALGKMTPNPMQFDNMIDLLHKTVVSKEIRCNDGNLENAQKFLGEFVAECLKNNRFPIIVGGGHETSYGHFLGYAFNGRKIEALNLDAHADVRELKEGKAHSGSPFRQMIEHPGNLLSHYSVFGLGRHCVAKEHVQFLREHNCDFHWIEDTRRFDPAQITSNRHHPFFLTVDTDVIDQSFMPAVSALNSNGVSSSWVYSATEAAGRNPNCTSFDMVEINPAFDQDSRGIKVGATILWHFLSGLSCRVC